VRHDDGPVAPRGGDGAVSPLKQARVDCGYSLPKVTELTGIAFGYVSELERQDKTTALITMCCGANVGTGTIIERI
jgi:hypothetical protein